MVYSKRRRVSIIFIMDQIMALLQLSYLLKTVIKINNIKEQSSYMRFRTIYSENKLHWYCCVLLPKYVFHYYKPLDGVSLECKLVSQDEKVITITKFLKILSILTKYRYLTINPENFIHLSLSLNCKKICFHVGHSGKKLRETRCFHTQLEDKFIKKFKNGDEFKFIPESKNVTKIFQMCFQLKCLFLRHFVSQLHIKGKKKTKLLEFEPRTSDTNAKI
ncbi:hypothetical protein NQ318_016140 [Aromia moschata]|uniref:Maturase K n=1 Tax=Aromia moschata TaxID=1265417 RepID=A0AAV8Y0A8_9CUCU|nr:hypothetical protein NQ318_016140 [Aromia moschata]